MVAPAPATPRISDLLEGARHIGPYRLIRQLGQGGAAPVWLAEERFDGQKLREVAIKLFLVPESIARSPAAASRWRDDIVEEARSLCRVEHPNVVRFYSLQRDDARGLVGLVMEHVAGRSLEALAAESGPLEEQAVLEAALAVAWALAAVHAAGLVHRDIKPANIVQGASGVKLIDFGIASGAGEAPSEHGLAVLSAASDPTDPTIPIAPPPGGATVTSAPSAPVGAALENLGGVLVGTLGYIAPERLLQGAPATPASDLYALGVTIFRLITGLLPYQVSGMAVPGSYVPRAAVPPLEGLVREPSRATGPLSRLTAALLEPDPGIRPRHADWVARELDGILALLGTARAAPPAYSTGSYAAAGLIAQPAPIHHAGVPPELDLRPALVGRDDALAALERAAQEAQGGRVRIVLLRGPQGIGRTRLLDAAAALPGWSADRILRLRCFPERRSPLYPLRRALDGVPPERMAALGQLPAAVERALSPAMLPGPDDAARAVEAIEDALVRASAAAPLLLLVDDLQWSDAPTLELLGLLVDRASFDGAGGLLVVLTARDEPSPPARLRALLGQMRAKACPGVRHLALAPLAAGEAARLAQTVSPLAPEVERAVTAGSGGVPFFIVHALLAWREGGAMTWSGRSWSAAAERILRAEVPGVAELLEARLAAYFPPGSDADRAARRALAAVALYGGPLGGEIVLELSGDEESAETALDALVSAGLLVTSGERQEYGFAQEMVRQAALNLLRPRSWFRRLHRALLDAVAREGMRGGADATFLATGYERLGDAEQARLWLGRAVEGALARGLFDEAAELGDHLAAFAPDPMARAGVELDAVRALIRGRKLEEARRRLARIEERAAMLARGSVLDLRRRICAFEVARGLRVPAPDDPTLLVDADNLGDPTLRCEARMALAGVAPAERAMELAGEAVTLSAECAPPMQFAARVLRLELNYALNRLDHALAERDLTQALATAGASLSAWQEVHIAGDLAVLEAEMGRTGASIERLRRLIERAEAYGMRGQIRLFSQNLAVVLLREGRAAEAAQTARRTAELATEAGDPVLRAAALSLRAAALRISGNLSAALESANEAERLQAERGDRGLALTLFRRADILDAMLRPREALHDARAARSVAEQVGNQDVALGARVLETLRLAQRGDVPAEALRCVLNEVGAAKVTLRLLTQRIVLEAEQWLAHAVFPARSAAATSGASLVDGPATLMDDTPPPSPTVLALARPSGG